MRLPFLKKPKPKRLYISYSMQRHNITVDGHTEYQDCLALARKLYYRLRSVSGLQVCIAAPWMKLVDIVKDSDKKRVDFHLVLHTDAGPPSAEGTTFLISAAGGRAEKYAKVLDAELLPVMKKTDPDGVHPDRGIRIRPDVYELRETDAPAVLVEVCFHTNWDDQRQLEQHMDEIADALARAVKKILGLAA